MMMEANVGQEPVMEDERILRALAEGTAAVTGTAFFQALVQNLARILEVDYAFVAEFTAVKTRVRTLAFWTPQGFCDNIEYDLANTPCEAVLQGEIRHYPAGIRNYFPHDRGMARWRVESYLAVPLQNPDGDVLGHLAVFDTKPMPAKARDMSLFRIFAARAAAELMRRQAEQRLRESEERLTRILASALDAVIVLDAQRRIVLFNPAAEKIFRCPVDQALGQVCDRFLSARFRALLERYLHTLAEDQHASQLWAPTGLTALRSNGEEFPIEATLSATEGRQRWFTLILRDINERQQAERQLSRLDQEKRYLQAQLNEEHGPAAMIGTTPTMQNLFGQLRKVAASDTTVLVLGETGVGKELVARAIHEASPRRERLLVKLNCAALPTELIESELFGHEKGAFTGATMQRKGRFELADGGTLFLDEVGELSASAQAKLLRVLQEQEFERVGGSRPIRVNVRVIAATNRDLAEMVQNSRFRADLYYRLNVFPLAVPPLRERRADIPLLARAFLDQCARKLGKSFSGLAARAVEQLCAYPWPGNIRELQNVIERAAILANGPLVEIGDDLQPCGGATAEPALAGTLEDVERSYITRVLEQCGWTVEGPQGAAAALGLNPSTLRFRMQKLGIKRPGRSS